MSFDVGWRADGIARARRAGGVDIEVYRRPGFMGGLAVRALVEEPHGGSGFDYGTEPDPTEPEFAARHAHAFRLPARP
jgi:hypothetical protein